MQQKSKIGNVFAKETGFNPVADENDIIILYPQAKASSFNPSNPNSCFDWYILIIQNENFFNYIHISNYLFSLLTGGVIQMQTMVS